MSKTNNRKSSKSTKTKKKKMKTWKKVLLCIVLILAVLIGLFAYKVHLNGGGMSGMLATMVGHDENTKKNLGELRVLILGISTDQDGVDLTDTIMVASYNPNTQKATLLSIPRDTYTGRNPARATAYEKINSLYSRKHRPDETLEAVNELTGLNIQYYVVVKTEALIKLVDAIGGVTFNVPIDMDYDDVTQDLHIHLKAGEQKLNGEQAEWLVRFRHNNDGSSYPSEYGDNDLGRMRTQREFIMQVIKQTAKPENIFKLGEILDIANEDLITNLDFNTLKDYIPYAVEFNTDNLLTATLPGTTPDLSTTNNVSIYVVDKKETKAMIEELFFNRDLEVTDDDTNTVSGNSTTNSISASSSKDDIDKSDLKIEILNGTGSDEALENAVNLIEGSGYNVKSKGSTTPTAKTTIINKKDIDDIFLKNIEDVLGIGEIKNSDSSSSKVDITIILGRDYNNWISKQGQ